MNAGDVITSAEVSAADVAKSVATLRYLVKLHGKQLRMLEQESAQDFKELQDQAKTRRHELTNLIYHSPAEDAKLCTFRRARAACYFVTLVYLLLWIVELFSPYRTSGWTVIEFMWTPIAETATVVELLVTLPSKDGGPAAVRHYLVLQIIFALGTCLLYAWKHKKVELGFTYLTIILVKAVLVGWLRGLARERLYDRFATMRREQAIAYLMKLLEIFGLQVAMLAGTYGQYKKKGLNRASLFAATSLSSVLPASFLLLIFVRDAGTISSERLSTFAFTAHEAAALTAIGAFAIIFVFAYAVDIENTSPYLARFLFFGYQGVYFVAAALVGIVVSKADKRSFEDAEWNKWRKLMCYATDDEGRTYTKGEYFYCKKTGYARWKGDARYDWEPHSKDEEYWQCKPKAAKKSGKRIAAAAPAPASTAVPEAPSPSEP